MHRRAVLTVLGLALTVPAFAQAGHSGVLDSIRIDNFARVSATYYRGSQPNGRDYTDLATLGVKTVIDLQEYGVPTERGLVEKAGMQYVNIPMTTRVNPTEAQIAQFLSIVNDPAKQPVYVHCAGGRHRTGVMTAIYRISDEGWTSDRAFKEMKQYRFGADFLHPEFKQFVYTYRPATKTPGILAVTVVPAAVPETTAAATN
jgi:protein tyrosine/serine phosphatase